MLQVTQTQRNGRIYYKILGDREEVIEETERLYFLWHAWNAKPMNPFVLDSGMWLGQVSHVKES